jgi:ABC-type multidrug transport system fused ATPase/permease subunit
MESIERVVAQTQPLDLPSADGYIGTMREFLTKPRVAREFQDLKADTQRLSAVRAERETLTEKAAEAELDAGRMARANDEHRQHRLPFGVGVFLATLFVVLDTLPANLAAQTFGLDPLPTWGITAVIVGALAAGMWAVTHYKAGWRRTVTIIALSIGLVAIGALRYWFLWVTAGDALAAVLEAVALTVFTTMMVWLGVLVLSFTKSRHVSAAERSARAMRRRAERKAGEERKLGRQLAAAKTEFMADAQLYSFNSFESEARRSQFLEYVRAELDR